MELQNHLFTVSELNQVIKTVLEQSFYEINLEGEISNFRPAASGHWYFSLKDRQSNISAVMFKNSSFAVNFSPKDGMKVKIKGKLSLYSQRGTYQIICSTLTLFGEGDILLMLEERKRKLASLGYFDPSKKLLLPRFPKRIGIVTSPTGAALQDILKVTKRRHCISNIVILPTLVQGSSAHKTIAKQIDLANRDRLCDLLLLTRGGGSLEDLLPFSEESVVKAISRSKIPIITGIGHEIDSSLSDFAADFRAATPSAAAEVATEGSQTLYTKISTLKKDMTYSVSSKLSKVRSELQIFNKERVRRELDSILADRKIHIDRLKDDILQSVSWQLKRDRGRIDNSKRSIESLSPYTLFNKGYSWVTINSKSIMDKKVKVGDNLKIKYKNGDLDVTIQEIE